MTMIREARCLAKCVALSIAALLASACATVEESPSAENEPDCRFDSALSVHCGRTPTAAIDASGTLWAVYVIGEHVHITRSSDQGRSWSGAVRVNRQPEPVYTNGENRPKIAFGPEGEIFVSWTKITEGRFAGDIRFTRSTDGGRHFEPVRTVNDDGLPTSHRFETLLVDSAGRIYLAWLDKRDQVRALEQGGEYNGAALYYTVSTDRGSTFEANRKVADFSCECCRIAMAETLDGNVAIFWRHIFGDNVRDHGFAVVGPEKVITPLQKPVEDNWRIEACPHHGPAMVVSDDGRYHLVWFSLGERKGITYARYDAASGEASQLYQVATTGSSHAHIARSERGLDLVWKQFDGDRTHIMLAHSADEGRRWQPPESIASTAGASDHPLLIQHDQETWLSWHSADEGLRLVPVAEFGGTRR